MTRPVDAILFNPDYTTRQKVYWTKSGSAFIKSDGQIYHDGMLGHLRWQDDAYPDTKHNRQIALKYDRLLQKSRNLHSQALKLRDKLTKFTKKERT